MRWRGLVRKLRFSKKVLHCTRLSMSITAIEETISLRCTSSAEEAAVSSALAGAAIDASRQATIIDLLEKGCTFYLFVANVLKAHLKGIVICSHISDSPSAKVRLLHSLSARSCHVQSCALADDT